MLIRSLKSVAMSAVALTLSGALLAEDSATDENEKILVQVDRVASPVVIDIGADNPTFTVDLAPLFQLYDAPGPVATFAVTLPEQDEEREVIIDQYGDDPAKRRLMTYKTDPEFKYESLFDINEHTQKRISADDFVMQAQKTFEVQLYPQEAPYAVANFIAQARANDDYQNLVIHHNLSGRALRSGLVQLNPDEDETAPPLAYTSSHGSYGLQPSEHQNVAGTLTAYRFSSQEGADRQWFFNTVDNTPLFEANNRYGYPQMVVFGALVAPEDLKILEEIAQAPTFNLEGYMPSANLNWESIPVALPFNQPDYTQQMRSTLLKFDSITVTAGTDIPPETIQFIEKKPEGQQPNEDLPESFDISFDGSLLTVTANDTDQKSLEITATVADQSVSFRVQLVSEDQWLIDLLGPGMLSRPEPGHSYYLGFLGPVTAEEKPYLESDFGKLYLEHYPWTYHPKHGYIWIEPIEPGAFDFNFYEQRLDTWVYTAPGQLEYFYLYSFNRWVSYSKDSGNLYDPTLPDDRAFWLFDEDEEIAGWYSGDALLEKLLELPAEDEVDDGAENDDEEQ